MKFIYICFIFLGQCLALSTQPFEDVSMSAGMVRRLGRRKKYGGPAVADLDGDGWPDLLFGHHGGLNCTQIYFNNQDGTFMLSPFTRYTDLHGITPLRLLPGHRRMHFINSNGGSSGHRPTSSTLYRVSKTREIKDVTRLSPEFSSTYVRGRTALVFSMKMNRDLKPRPDVLLISHGSRTADRHFGFRISGSGRLLSETVYPKEFRQNINSYGTLTDIDGDGRMEVIFLGRLSLWKLVDDFTFKEYTTTVFPNYSDKLYFGSWAVSEFDYNNDGLWDLFIVRSATGHFQFYNRGFSNNIHMNDMLLQNVDGKRYRNMTRYAHIPTDSYPPTSQGVTTADFDNDGYIDIFIVRFTSKPSYVLLRNLGNGKFESVDPGFSRNPNIDGDGVVAVDYDRDGRIDLVVSEGNWGEHMDRLGYYRIMKNTWVTGNNFLLVRVKSAPGLTTTSVNAVVYVTFSDGFKMMRRIGSPGTKVSVSYIEVAHFGLGKRFVCGAVSVRWSDGTVRRMKRVMANSTIEFGE